MNNDSSLTALTELALTQAEEPDTNKLFDVADTTAQAIIGHRLFTILVVDQQSMEVERLYSSRPDEYPVSGRKKMRDTSWGKMVLERGEPYIGHSADDIRLHFPDHETIIGMGLESILNMPVRHGGQTIATINLLHQADHYSETDLVNARLIAGLLAVRL